MSANNITKHPDHLEDCANSIFKPLMRNAPKVCLTILGHYA